MKTIKQKGAGFGMGAGKDGFPMSDFAAMVNGSLDDESFAFKSRGPKPRPEHAANPLQAAFDAKTPVEGVVGKEVNGGYEVTIASQRAFCPFSQINLHRVEGAKYEGERFSFIITELGEDERGTNLIVSRRAFLEREREAQREKLVAELEEGATVTGKVTRLAEFGAFVDLGGVDGLIPLRELSWERNVKPEDVVKIGDVVEVEVKKLDWAANRISLSLRAARPDPFDTALVQFPVGSTFTGKIVRIERFGAFVTLLPGVDGLVPTGKLGKGRRILTPLEVVKVGDELLLKVEAIDIERRRISLVPVSDEPVKPAPAAAPKSDADAVDVTSLMEETRRASAGLGAIGDVFSGLKL